MGTGRNRILINLIFFIYIVKSKPPKKPFGDFTPSAVRVGNYTLLEKLTGYKWKPWNLLFDAVLFIDYITVACRSPTAMGAQLCETLSKKICLFKTCAQGSSEVMGLIQGILGDILWPVLHRKSN